MIIITIVDDKIPRVVGSGGRINQTPHTTTMIGRINQTPNTTVINTKLLFRNR